MSEKPVLETHVARQEWEEYHFRGYRVFEQLAGRLGYWDMLSLAVDGPRLTDADRRVLDDLCGCGIAADPRIPALKVGRLASAYGSSIVAFSTIFLPLEGGLFGPWSAYPAARFLVRVRQELVEPWTDEQVRQRVERLLSEGRRIHGFGVPVRTHDERVKAFDHWLERRGRADRTYWRLLRALDRVLVDLKGWGANLSVAYAAALLDMGLEPKQIPLFSIGIVLPCAISNAYEGAEQAPAVLQNLPPAWVDYDGPGPRESPRSRQGRGVPR